MANQPEPAGSTNQVMRLSINVQWVVVVLLVVIVAMLLLWRTWQGAGLTNRTIEVTGDTTLTAHPDEFIFSPSYQAKSADKTAALTELSTKSDAIVKELKKLGVAGSKIKTSTSGYDYPVYYGDNNTAIYTLQLTITVGNLSLAQKVQDYLVT